MEDFDFFFLHEEPEFALFFQSICGEHPEWFAKELKEEQKGEIQLAFLQEFSEEEVASFFENPAWADNRIRETIDRFQRQKEAQESRTECKQP